MDVYSFEYALFLIFSKTSCGNVMDLGTDHWNYCQKTYFCSQMRCERTKDIEVYCDLYTPGEVPEYFFDR
jgi:hypothetical protein